MLKTTTDEAVMTHLGVLFVGAFNTCIFCLLFFEPVFEILVCKLLLRFPPSRAVRLTKSNVNVLQ